MKRVFALSKTSLLAAATQALGLLQLLLLVQGNPSAESDSYFYLITWAQLPTQILLSGYVYPTWLSSVNGVRRRLVIAITAAPLMAVLGVVVAGIIFSNLSSVQSTFWWQVALFSVLGIALSAGWSISLRLSADGNSLWVSCVTLLSNVFSCAVLLILFQAPQAERLSAMLVAQIAGMALTVFLALKAHPDLLPRLFSNPVDGRATKSPVDWYLAQAIVSYGGLLILQTSSVALAPAALSILGIIGRFVAGLNTVITSAVVPRLVHSQTQTDHRAVAFIRISAAGSLVLALVCLVAGNLANQNSLLLQAAVILAWFAAAVLNSTMKRLAIRSLEPTFSLIPLLLNLATSAVVGLLSLSRALTFETLILAYVLMDLAPALVLSLILRRPATGLIVSSLSLAILLCAVSLMGGL